MTSAFLSGAGGDPNSLVFNTLLNRTQNLSADIDQTTFGNLVNVPGTLNVTGSVSNSKGNVIIEDNLDINGSLGLDNKLKSITVTNRDLALCDSNGNGLPGMDPNADSLTNEIWGPTVFNSEITLDRKLNPGNPTDTLGNALNIYNQYQQPYYDADGTVHPALTRFQWGHDAQSKGGAVMQLFQYYGPGHWANKFTIDAVENFSSEHKAISQTMPMSQLITTPSVLQNSISTTGSIGTIVNVNFDVDTLNTGLPIPGQTVTIRATPAGLSVTNAKILTVEYVVGAPNASAHTITYEFNSTAGDLTSTSVDYVYYGPGVYGDGQYGYVTYNNGPIPVVGQTVTILAQPSSLSITNAVIVYIGNTANGKELAFEYPVGTSFPTITPATIITSVEIGPGNVGENPNYGKSGFFGIHTSNPQVPLDVTGDFIIREEASEYPLVFTYSDISANEATFLVSNPYQGGTYVIPMLHCLTVEQMIYFYDHNLLFPYMQFDLTSGHTTWFAADAEPCLDIRNQKGTPQFNFFKSDGTTPLFQIDQATNSVTFDLLVFDTEKTTWYNTASLKCLEIKNNTATPEIIMYQTNGTDSLFGVSQAVNTVAIGGTTSINGNTTWYDLAATKFVEILSQQTNAAITILKSDGVTPLFKADQNGNVITMNGTIAAEGNTTWLNASSAKCVEIKSKEVTPEINFYRTDGTTALLNINQATNTITFNGTVNGLPSSTGDVLAFYSTASKSDTLGTHNAVLPTLNYNGALATGAYPGTGMTANAYGYGFPGNETLGLWVTDWTTTGYITYGGTTVGKPASKMFYLDGNVQLRASGPMTVTFNIIVTHGGTPYSIFKELYGLGAPSSTYSGYGNITFAVPVILQTNSTVQCNFELAGNNFVVGTWNLCIRG